MIIFRLASVVLFGLIILGGCQDDDDLAASLEAASTPQEFVSLTINTSEAKVEVSQIKDVIFIEYRLDPRMLTGSVGKSNFDVMLEKIIPRAFYRFRDVNEIEVVATAAFTRDVRGHDRGRGDVLKATFTRANAESIDWEHIYRESIAAT
jgi:hypothetical protein